MLQPPFDHLVAQPIAVLANCRAGHEMMLVLSVCIDLLPNVFVKSVSRSSGMFSILIIKLLRNQRTYFFTFNPRSTRRLL
jgi:hypothetical protein